MASTDVRDELLCSICLNIYKDPVTLRCGNNFCRVCIDRVLDTQDESGVYSCPECREEFQKRPALQRNITLHNVAERLLSSQPHQEEITGICCTYCIHSPVPAVRSCLLCEASLCDNHLKVHSKGPEHVLTDPSTSLENKKCSIHKKILEYYCTEDPACICVSCSLVREDWVNSVEMLDEASEKKEKLRNVLKKLITKREKTEERVWSLEERYKKSQKKASGEAERVTALFIDIRRRLDDLEKRILSDICRQEEKVSLSLSDVILKLEIKKDELSRKMRHIEELCNMADPLTVLQDPDTGDLCDPEEEGGDEDTGDLCDPEEEGGDEDTGGHDKTHDVDVDVITGMLHAGFSEIMVDLQIVSPAKPRKKRKHYHRDQSPPSHTQDFPVSGKEYGGNHVIVRTGGDDVIVRTGGDDVLVRTGGDDVLVMNEDDDIIVRTGVDDVIVRVGGDDVIVMNEDDDILVRTGGDDVIVRTGGDDVIVRTGIDDVIVRAGGDDVIVMNEDDDILVRTGGDDVIVRTGGDDVIVRTGGDDVIVRTGGDDVIVRTGGDDVIVRTGGDDVIVRTGGVGGKLTAAGEGGIYGQDPADILLDVNTVADNLLISDDLKTATWTLKNQNRPETAERFQDNQVMSSRRFSSGRHYWDVEISRSGLWMVGMCYPSIDRRGDQSYIGDNTKSWCLYGGLLLIEKYLVMHNGELIQLPPQISSDRVRICLDYEAGQLSFYELCDPIRHLHTVTATFTEPLHAVLHVDKGSIKISGEQF